MSYFIKLIFMNYQIAGEIERTKICKYDNSTENLERKILFISATFIGLIRLIDTKMESDNAMNQHDQGIKY